jgi:hypothetical protein
MERATAELDAELERLLEPKKRRFSIPDEHKETAA